MTKNFNSWNEVKKVINSKERNIKPRIGEIWICNIGLNVGFETDGKNLNYVRPVLVIKTYGYSGVIVLPLTSKYKYNKFHFRLGDDSFVKITQIRFMDLKRLKRKIGKVSKCELRDIKFKLNKLLE